MEIEILYFEDCPNHLPTVALIRQVLREENCGAEVREVLVPDPASARKLRFLGSPSVRIDGIDIDPTADSRTDFGLMCRRYTDGIPSCEMIRKAIQSAATRGAQHE